MSEHHDLLADVSQEDNFEKEMRGYSRRQVDEFVARARGQSRELAHALDENERLRLEMSSVRQSASDKPAHEEISERVGQILKLADDEARAQKNRAVEEIAKLRNDVKQETEKLRNDIKQETEKFRAEAHEQAERMLSAAQEQAENSIASARAEAEKTRTAARTEAERSVTEAHKQAETAVGSSKSQAKQVLDEATARATAIHDGAERRLNLLMSRHTEAIRRLTEIRDVVTSLVAGEVARGSLEEEVAKAVANSVAESQSGGPGNGKRAPMPGEGRHAPGAPAAVGAAPSVVGTGQPGARERSGDVSQPRTQAPGLGGPAGPSGPTRPGGEHRPGETQHGQGGGPSGGPSSGEAAGPNGPRQAPPARSGNGHGEGHQSGPAHQAGPGDGAKHAAGSPTGPGGSSGSAGGSQDDTATGMRVIRD